MGVSEALVDVAGHTIEPGDTVVYPQMSGRSVQMVLGTLVSYDGKVAQIRRQEGSRWNSHYISKRYRDKRTGKGIDKNAASGKHYKVLPRSGYRHRETGEEISERELYTRYPYGLHGTYGLGGYTDHRAERAKWDAFYDSGVLHDYVEEYTPEPTPVTIRNVSNLVKVVPADEQP